MSFPGPCAHFTLASCGPGTFSHVCDIWGRRVVYRKVNFCVGKDSHSFQAMKECSKSILVGTVQSPPGT